MGSTGIGNGIAIPHGRIAGLKDVVAIVVTTESAIDFEAIDHKPVDVFFALLVPQEQIEGHLQTLAAVAAKLNDPDIVAGIRRAKTPQDILLLLK
jgi:PTS system nitrogen regulatory IIA component